MMVMPWEKGEKKIDGNAACIRSERRQPMPLTTGFAVGSMGESEKQD